VFKTSVVWVSIFNRTCGPRYCIFCKILINFLCKVLNLKKKCYGTFGYGSIYLSLTHEGYRV